MTNNNVNNNNGMSAIGSAAVSAVASILDSVVSGAANANLNKRTRLFNAQEAQKARDFQLEMWNKSNEYSSPLQTMQRLTEANLNPNLIYNSSGQSLTAASVPSASQASSNSSAFWSFEIFFSLACSVKYAA